MTQLQTTFEYGLNAAVGTAAQTKSYSYDEAQYVYSQSMQSTIGPAVGGGAAQLGTLGVGVAYFPCYTQKQLRSITAQRVGTATSGAGDSLSVYLVSAFAQAFGTATGVTQINTAVGTGTLYTTSTLMGTGVNLVTIPLIQQWTTGAQGPAGTGGIVGGTCGASVQVTQLDNGTYTVVVSNPQGTNSQTGYVFPIGPQGGLTCNPGDTLIVSKSSTDTLAAYVLELEFTYTPGAYVTR
jgi:hypothetical protein